MIIQPSLIEQFVVDKQIKPSLKNLFEPRKTVFLEPKILYLARCIWAYCLHPRYHAALAEYFFDLARQDNPPQVLLETHSENFLLRTQLEIARGKLEPKSVMVYWVRQFDDGRSIAEPVTFDQQGRGL